MRRHDPRRKDEPKKPAHPALEAIEEAMKRGDFDNLPGRGKPLNLEPLDLNDPLGMATKIRKNANAGAPWEHLQWEIETGLARAKRRRGKDATDRFEGEGVEFHEELRRAYLALAAKEPKRCVVIDGRAPRAVVAERIWSAVEQRLHPELQRLTAETTAP